MLKNIRQTDSELLKVIQKYGCFFLCFAEASPLIFEGKLGKYALNGMWERAMELGYITDDLNKDGDFDEVGEAEIKNPNAILKMFNLNLKYDDKHHEAEECIPVSARLIIGQYWWKSGHFVILNKHKEVTFDSMGSSYTVKYGTLKTMRWYYAD